MQAIGKNKPGSLVFLTRTIERKKDAKERRRQGTRTGSEKLVEIGGESGIRLQ